MYFIFNVGNICVYINVHCRSVINIWLYIFIYMNHMSDQYKSHTYPVYYGTGVQDVFRFDKLGLHNMERKNQNVII